MDRGVIFQCPQGVNFARRLTKRKPLPRRRAGDGGKFPLGMWSRPLLHDRELQSLHREKSRGICL
jgi:hypothetical protein